MNDQERLETRLRGGDALRAAQRWQDTIGALETLYDLRAEKEERNPSVCGTASLALVLGPERVPLSEAEKFQRPRAILDKIGEFVESGEFDIKIPSSANKFIRYLETGALGALVMSDKHERGKGTIGHVVGVVPTWEFKGKEEQTIPKRKYLTVNTSPCADSAFKLINEEGLIDLYSSATVVEHIGDREGERNRAVFVIKDPDPEE